MSQKEKQTSMLIRDNEKLKEKIRELEGINSSNDKLKKLLKESKEKYGLYYDNAPLAYQSLDVNGSILEVNKTWYKLLGYSEKEVIGQNLHKVLKSRLYKSIREGLQKIQKDR